MSGNCLKVQFITIHKEKKEKNKEQKTKTKKQKQKKKNLKFQKSYNSGKN